MYTIKSIIEFFLYNKSIMADVPIIDLETSTTYIGDFLYEPAQHASGQIDNNTLVPHRHASLRSQPTAALHTQLR